MLPTSISCEAVVIMKKKANVSKELNARHWLLKLPENRERADCKSKGPRWASMSLGILICMQCSGIHRSLGFTFQRNALGRENGEYEFLQLILQWPKSYCNTASLDCKHIPNRFTISRFSPMYYPDIIVPPFNYSQCELTTEPVELHEDDFDDELRHKMETHWLSLEGLNFKLWNGDWINYGKCFNTPTSPRSYFKAGLRLEGRGDVLNILDRHGIKPSGDEKPDIGDIRSALEKHFRVKEVNIICNTDAKGTIQLFQVGICFNRDEDIQGCEPIDVAYSLCDYAPNEEIAFP